MLIRRSLFVQVPTWALDHECMVGDATKTVVYVALNRMAYEYRDHEWRSISEIAFVVSELTDLAVDTCRRHISELRGADLIVLDEDYLTIPMDDPSWAGSCAPGHNSCAPGHNAPSSIRDLDREKENADAQPNFDEFWALYPKRVAKPAARRSLKAALRKAPLEDILDGLRRWNAYWKAANTERDFIPYPTTWLNQDRWTDDPGPGTPAPRGANASKFATGSAAIAALAARGENP